MSDLPIVLIDHGNFEEDILMGIAGRVENEYHQTVHVSESYLDLSGFYDPARRQYNGNKLLMELGSLDYGERSKIVGLFRVDLFIPILTYIFGQAALNGRTGIVSLYRLRNEQYGMPKDDALLLKRFGKVVIHELGHMFGLVHCHTPHCVMRSSTYVEDIDQKGDHLCVNCKSEISSVRYS